MSEFFNFDVADFQVLEDIEFDETVQRPEKIRFYTLGEQVVDAYEKLIPKGRVTRFQLVQTQKDVDRLKDLYDTYIIPSADDYLLREPTFGRKIDWVYPVYASGDLKPYDYNVSWKPLFDNVRVPNFYPRMISALPRPYTTVEGGHPYPLEAATEFLNAEGQKPLRALPVYTATKTQHHEDKTIDVLDFPIDGTGDIMDFVGYYLAKRPLEIPNPLAEHPFLKANESTMVTTTAPLADVLPSLDAIMTHAVPVTTDPYGEGMQYLRLYDIRLQDIPWTSWRSRFPPAEVISTMPTPADIPYPKTKEDKPSEKLTEAYKVSYFPGISSRYWLMNQADGGDLVVQMLLSESINNGSVESVPDIGLAPPTFPITTLEECNLLGIPFTEFMIRGNLRRTVGTNALQCIPLEFVRQERKQLGYKNRLPWKETTKSDILTAHLRRLEAARPPAPLVVKVAPIPKTPMKNDSLRRKEVVAVLNDERRFAEDKLKDIQELLKETLFSNQIYTDSEGLFVLCAHTISVLSGDLATDRLGFYDKWTSTLDGFRVCKYCGERVNADVLLDQEDFDDEGHIIKHTDALDQKAFRGTEIAEFTTGIRAIQPIFTMDSPVDSTCYLLLTLLQVLPSVEATDPILKLGRALAVQQFGSKDSDQVNRFKGMIGIAETAILLQTHIPALIPRRAFGSKPLKLDGYPRDSDKPEEYSIVDSLLMVIRKTFEAFPTSFRGPSLQVIRGTLNAANDVKKGVFVFIRKLLENRDVKSALMAAKTYRADIPMVEQPKALIPVVVPPKAMDTIRRLAECPSSRPVWTSGRPPRSVQPVVPLRKNIYAAKNRSAIEPAVSERTQVADVPVAEIQARYKKKPATSKIEVGEAYRTNVALASRLSDIFDIPADIRSINPEQSPDDLRDIAQGYVFELLRAIQADPVKRVKLESMKEKDITLYVLLADVKKAKTSVNTLRARERNEFTSRMAAMTDMEREITRDLLDKGLAPYITTNKDRELWSKQLERELDIRDDEVFDVDADIAGREEGVGLAHDFEDQGEVPVEGADNGNYGDYQAQPVNDGRDYYQPAITDDSETSV